jgi:hypothetical protein
MTGAFVMPARTTTHAATHTTKKDNHNTQRSLLCHPTMADAPPVKPWGQNDKELLQKLIDRRKIDLSRTSDTDYIDKICQKYFRPRDNRNFRHNFRSYARSRDL